MLLPQDFCGKKSKPLRGSQSKNLNFFEFSRVFPDDQPLAKEPEDFGYKMAVETDTHGRYSFNAPEAVTCLIDFIFLKSAGLTADTQKPRSSGSAKGFGTRATSSDKRT